MKQKKFKRLNYKTEYYVVDENLKIIGKFKYWTTAKNFFKKREFGMFGKLEILPVEVYEYQKAEKKKKNDI